MFLSRHRDGHFPSDLPSLITTIQDIAKTDSSQLQFKPLQLLRFCTKQPEYRNYLLPQFLVQINEMMPQVTNSPPVLIQLLALHLRFIERDAKLITHEMFCKIMDLLVMNNPEATKVILEITRQLVSKGISQVFQEVWYVGRLVFALERLEPSHKPKLINIVRDLLQNRQFN